MHKMNEVAGNGVTLPAPSWNRVLLRDMTIDDGNSAEVTSVSITKTDIDPT